MKLRSRNNAGYPNIDLQLCIPPAYDNEELNDYAQYRWTEEFNEERWWLPHLFCNIFHHYPDEKLFRDYPNRYLHYVYNITLTLEYRVWKCGEALCFDSAQCGWTNNPILFKKHWFLDTLVSNAGPTFLFVYSCSMKFPKEKIIQPLKEAPITHPNGLNLTSPSQRQKDFSGITK